MRGAQATDAEGRCGARGPGCGAHGPGWHRLTPVYRFADVFHAAENGDLGLCHGEVCRPRRNPYTRRDLCQIGRFPAPPDGSRPGSRRLSRRAAIALAAGVCPAGRRLPRRAAISSTGGHRAGHAAARGSSRRQKRTRGAQAATAGFAPHPHTFCGLTDPKCPSCASHASSAEVSAMQLLAQ